MTININIPPGQTHWGPGVFFPFQTSIVQPSGAPFTITIDLWRTSPEQLLWHYTLPVQQNIQGGLRLFYDENLVPLLVDASGTAQQGDNVLLKIEARDDAGLVVDQGERALPWSPVVQLHDELVLQPGGTVQGGFTAQDRANANITQMGVALPLPGLGVGSEIASGVTGFFTNPPSWAQQLLETIEISGRGSLVRPGSNRTVNAYGCQIDFLTVPAALSRDDGNPETFHERVVQLAVVDQGLANREFYRLTADFYFDHQRLMWGTPFPIRVDYYVLPNCVASLTWLHLAPAWWPF